ncbi:MAG: CBS domain-containing protein [Rhodospirillales bacterium]|nr:CBS domain-containing protein [Rhodospirillales bacterium]
MASKTLTAADIMSTKLFSIAPGAGVRLAAEYMLKRRVSALLVLDPKKRLLGIVSEGDLVKRAELGAAKKGSWWLEILTTDRDLARQYARAHGRRVADVMTRTCIVAGPDAPVATLAEMMERHKIKRIPIVDEGRVVGVVARADLVAAFVRTSGTVAAVHAANDAGAAAEIRRRIGREPWIGSTMVSVSVAKGIAAFSGIVSSVAQRDALRAIAEDVEGVRRADLGQLRVDKRAIALTHAIPIPMP